MGGLRKKGGHDLGARGESKVRVVLWCAQQVHGLTLLRLGNQQAIFSPATLTPSAGEKRYLRKHRKLPKAKSAAVPPAQRKLPAQSAPGETEHIPANRRHQRHRTSGILRRDRGKTKSIRLTLAKTKAAAGSLFTLCGKTDVRLSTTQRSFTRSARKR
jgi:hypothetical protein